MSLDLNSGNQWSALLTILVLLSVWLMPAQAGTPTEPDIRAYPLSLDFSEAGNPPSQYTTDPVGKGDNASDKRSLYVQSQQARQVQAQSIAQKAEQGGPVRIIVGVDTPFRLIGALSDSAAAQQTRDIDLAQRSVIQLMQGPGSREIRRFRHIPFMVLEVDAAAVRKLVLLPEVLSIEELIPEAPNLQSSNPVIGSPQAWAEAYDGTGQVVVVLDTGVDKAHPWFSIDSKVVSEACFSTTTGSGSSASESMCPGGVPSSIASGSGLDCPDSIYNCDHGTHVAGIAVGNDHIGPNYGVARGAELISIQVYSSFDSCNSASPPCALTWPDDQIAALEHIYLNLRHSHEIAAVNMSLGGGSYSSEESCDLANPSRLAAIDNLKSVGIATVISSGNNSRTNATGAPGCISSAIGVGSSTDTDSVSGFSNIASFVDLLAPGSSIDSAKPGGGIQTISGTSMAAPHVAGAWAVFKQQSAMASVNDVLNRFQVTGDSIDDDRSGGSVDDLRRINLDLALGLYPGITLFNDGDSVLNISSIMANDPTPWISLTPEPPFAIAAGDRQQLTVDIDYALAPPGISVSELLIASNDPDESPLPGGITINVTALDRPEINTVPDVSTSLDFDDVIVNTQSDNEIISIENTGNLELTLSCGLSGGDMGSFSIVECPENLAAMTSGPLEIACNPDTTGMKTASLDINSNDADESHLSFELLCNSVPIPEPEFESVPPPGEIVFGEVEIASASEPVVVLMKNTGGLPLSLTCNISGDTDNDFSIEPCPENIAGFSEVMISVNCSPDTLGDKTASLDLTTNDANEPAPTYPLTCKGVSIEFDSNPAAGSDHFFGNVEIHTSSPVFDVRIDSLGTGSLAIGCALGGADLANFSIDQCPDSVAGGESSHILVSCQPLTAGDKTASLSLTTNDSDEPAPSWMLHCTGKEPPPELMFQEGFESL